MCTAPNCLLDRIAAAEAARNAFVAQWGLDDKAQDLLVRLDHYRQQKMMNDFPKKLQSKGVKYVFKKQSSALSTGQSVALVLAGCSEAMMKSRSSVDGGGTIIKKRILFTF